MSPETGLQVPARAGFAFEAATGTWPREPQMNFPSDSGVASAFFLLSLALATGSDGSCQAVREV